MIKSLQEIYKRYQASQGHGDKGTTHSYIDEYQRLLEPYRNNSTILEIGLYEGLSLLMWDEYFINSVVVGIDVHLSEPLSKLVNQQRYNIIIGDATHDNIMTSLEPFNFDVIIDDGSHRIEDQVKSFNLLKSKMNKGGIYIIEDVDNLDKTEFIYKVLHNNIEIIDNRHIKGRYDDVLIVYKF